MAGHSRAWQTHENGRTVTYTTFWTPFFRRAANAAREAGFFFWTWTITLLSH